MIDTGETFGIIPTSAIINKADFDLILFKDDGEEAEISDDDEAVESLYHEATGKGDAAAWLAKMEGTKTMAKKIAGEHEKAKFWRDYNNYQTRSEYGTRDWCAMAHQSRVRRRKREVFRE